MCSSGRSERKRCRVEKRSKKIVEEVGSPPPWIPNLTQSMIRVSAEVGNLWLNPAHNPTTLTIQEIVGDKKGAGDFTSEPGC
jgi:hypothetical protein